MLKIEYIDKKQILDRIETLIHNNAPFKTQFDNGVRIGLERAMMEIENIRPAFTRKPSGWLAYGEEEISVGDFIVMERFGEKGLVISTGEKFVCYINEDGCPDSVERKYVRKTGERCVALADALSTFVKDGEQSED